MIPALSTATTDHSLPPPDEYHPHRRRQHQQRRMRWSPLTTSFLVLILWYSGFGSFSSTSPITKTGRSMLAWIPMVEAAPTEATESNEQTGIYHQSRRGGRTLTLVMNCLAFIGDKVEKIKVWCSEKLLALLRRTQNRNNFNPNDDGEVVQQQDCDATEETTAEGSCPVVTAEEEEEAYYDTTKTIETDLTLTTTTVTAEIRKRRNVIIRVDADETPLPKTVETKTEPNTKTAASMSMSMVSPTQLDWVPLKRGLDGGHGATPYSATVLINNEEYEMFIDTGTAYSWVTTTMCDTDECKSKKRLPVVRPKSQALNVSFGEWGTLTGYIGNETLQFGTVLDPSFSLIMASYYEGVQFGTLAQSGCIAVRGMGPTTAGMTSIFEASQVSEVAFAFADERLYFGPSPFTYQYVKCLEPNATYAELFYDGPGTRLTRWTVRLMEVRVDGNLLQMKSNYSWAFIDTGSSGIKSDPVTKVNFQALVKARDRKCDIISFLLADPDGGLSSHTVVTFPCNATTEFDTFDEQKFDPTGTGFILGTNQLEHAGATVFDFGKRSIGFNG